MTFRKSLLAGLASVLVLSACTDDGGDPISPGGGPAAVDSTARLRAQAALTAHPWVATRATIDPPADWNDDGILVSDILAADGTCARDDHMEMFPDGTWATDPGQVACPQTSPAHGRWWVGSAGDSLYQTIGIHRFGFEIRTLTPDTLVTILRQDWVDGVKRTQINAWKAK